ncbi:MAG: hypothetical protein N4A46_09665 [Schleiferiaceae bacterium]|jgi:hypothetical protein|nr:hypothetical protein [Schleiferiaceae bacterium]
MKTNILSALTFIAIIFGVGLIFRFSFDETPICFSDSLYPTTNWKSKPNDRYCIMRRLVEQQELINMKKEDVIKLLGDPFYEIDNADGTKFARYDTKHGAMISTYFLALTYEDGIVIKMKEGLD